MSTRRLEVMELFGNIRPRSKASAEILKKPLRPVHLRRSLPRKPRHDGRRLRRLASSNFYFTLTSIK